MMAKILFIDDDPNVLQAHQRAFRKRYEMDSATSGPEALNLLATRGPYAVIVTDLRMPGMTGTEFFLKAQERTPDTVRIMLTGHADQATAIDAVNRGHVYAFLTKPCNSDMLGMTIDNGIRHHQLITAERELLEKTLAGSIRVLTDILALQDPAAFGLAQTLRDRVRTFAEHRRIDRSWELEMGAMLAPVGLVTVPASVLAKLRGRQPLDTAEQEMLRRVPQIGAELLAHIPRLEPVSRIVLYQSKNFDGSGFPDDSVWGRDIPIGARVLRVLRDLLDLESTGLPHAEAAPILQQRPGVYDPVVLDSVLAFCDIMPQQVQPSRNAPAEMCVRELLVGQVLASDVETTGGILLVRAGTKISPLLLEKLKNFAKSSGIKEPFLVDR